MIHIDVVSHLIFYFLLYSFCPIVNLLIPDYAVEKVLAGQQTRSLQSQPMLLAELVLAHPLHLVLPQDSGPLLLPLVSEQHHQTLVVSELGLARTLALPLVSVLQLIPAVSEPGMRLEPIQEIQETRATQQRVRLVVEGLAPIAEPTHGPQKLLVRQVIFLFF